MPSAIGKEEPFFSHFGIQTATISSDSTIKAMHPHLQPYPDPKHSRGRRFYHQRRVRVYLIRPPYNNPTRLHLPVVEQWSDECHRANYHKPGYHDFGQLRRRTRIGNQVVQTLDADGSVLNGITGGFIVAFANPSYKFGDDLNMTAHDSPATSSTVG